MDGFTYINIFDTKGIEYLVIIAFLILIIPYWRLLNKPLKAGAVAVSSVAALTASALRIPQGLYYSRNHTWAFMEKAGYARVGLDDLLLHITGQVELKNFRNAGEKVKRGDTIAAIAQNGAHLLIKSPITGEIQQVNNQLKSQVGAVNDDPYGKGWLYKIKPEKWTQETKSYFLSTEASLWFQTELLRFKDFMAVTLNKYSPQMAPVILQEGGELADFPLSGMPVEVWNDFQEGFLDQVC